MKKTEMKSEKNSLVKRIIVVLIILFVLITGCTSGFFGKVGRLFENFSEYIFSGNQKLVKIYNEDLKFISKKGEVEIDDTYKLEFVTDEIDAEEFNCVTSDANIATCIVKDNYVEVYPKKIGTVTISVITKTNGKEYIGTHKLTIKDVERKIELSNNNFNIYLNESKFLKIPFKLNNLEGNVEVNVSNPKVLNAVIKNNTIEITSLSIGQATVTISVKYNDTVYSNKLNVNVFEKRPIVIKSNVNDLSELFLENFSLSPSFDKDVLNYTVDVESNVSSIKINVKKEDSKSKLYYTLNGEKINSLNNVQLDYGSNELEIAVQAEDGTIKKYTIIINREEEVTLSDVNTLDSIVGISEFNKDVLNYNVELASTVESVNLNVFKTDAKSTVEYYIDNVSVNDLNNISLEKNVTKQVKIVVTSESGKKKTYTLNLTRKEEIPPAILSDVNTLDKIIGISGFDKNTLNYNFEYEYEVENINLSVIKTDTKSIVEYYIDNVSVNSLNNIALEANKTKVVKIVVTSESGKKKTYTLNIFRKVYIASTINTLDSLIIKNYNFIFDKNVNDYEVIVDYNTNNVDLDYVLTSNKSSISYKLNSNTITNIDAVNLNEGINSLEIIVRSEAGTNNTYKITIKKPIRKIVLDKGIKTFNIESGTVDIVYQIYEDRDITDTWVLVNNYNLDDVSISLNNFNGTYVKNKDYITLNFSNLDINNTYTMNVSYLTKLDSLTFKVIMNNYFINTLKDNYKFDLTEDNANIILNTNMFNNDIEYLDITNGIRMYNNKGYINIISSNPSVLKVLRNLDNNNSTYIAFKLDLLNAGIVDINITGNIYDREIINKNITVNIDKKYSVVIDANGGMFNSFTNKYEYLKEKNDIVSLSEYNPYKIDETGNCLYYIIDSYNTLKDGTGISYSVNDTITITSDITLYAIYKSTSEYKEIEEDKTIYLTDVDLFYNEEYYKYYNIKKMIYPGANGSHVMYLENNTDSIIKFNYFNIKENTTCNNDGCINMGYVVKYTKPNENNWNYLYGTSNEYKILNSDSNVTKNYVDGENSIKLDIDNNIVLNPGEKVEVSILWEWVEVNDKLDTELGYIATDEYMITISLDYTEINSYCDLD